jgi:hypothetical protein
MNAPQTLKIRVGNNVKKQRVVDGNEPIYRVVYNLLHRCKDNGEASNDLLLCEEEDYCSVEWHLYKFAFSNE